MTDDARRRNDVAMRLGKPAMLRLRAEVLLQHGADGRLPLTQAERERLDRIALDPRDGDDAFLGGFDWFYEQQEREEDDD